ncbi:MBOAT family O-acyltransferase [Bradyrhizobium sp.]|uniref:MBOAT family O-acyltransferase n=1 Tax=Bradyrhizobium sp. TaxID=376 RepID=UPI0039E6A17A
MLFNSVVFIFCFYPAVLLGFFVLGRLQLRKCAIAWLLAASLIFYGWDDPARLLPIIVASGVFNFLVGRGLTRQPSSGLLFLGVAANLALLGYFKYASFFMENVSLLTGMAAPSISTTLPIGISFYTFTQIAFLVDAYRREAREYDFLKYGLFIAYFPHVIAGPILHHKEMMPQFDDPKTFQPRLTSVTIGLSWFTFGLFKKVILADNIAAFVDAPFKTAASQLVGFGDAWIGALSYTLQIYFDFSGYSDMAIGLAMIMGIAFPLNFASPYKAASIIDFWRRWHMTLSRFLRDYLYFPLGGNRKGPFRRHLNLMITMVLGGLWHGATWNFVVWGAIHGTALLINHLWRGFADRYRLHLPHVVGWFLTALLVVFAWVPFRAETLGSSLEMWRGMLGLNGIGDIALLDGHPLRWIAILSCIALFFPNTQQTFQRGSAAKERLLQWRPNVLWAGVIGCLFGIAIAGTMTKPTVFLYFRF